MKKVISLLVLLLLLGACRNESQLGVSSYVKYVEDPEHQLKRSVRSGNIEYSIQLATPEYMACLELSDKHDENAYRILPGRIDELKGHIFFIIRCAIRKTAESVSETMHTKSNAEAVAMYYQAQAAEDISLWNGTKQYMPEIYHYEDNYGLAPYNTIVVGFEYLASPGDIKLVFNDSLNENPIVQMVYSNQLIKKLPSLKLNS